MAPLVGINNPWRQPQTFVEANMQSLRPRLGLTAACAALLLGASVSAIAAGSPQRLPQLPDVPTLAESGLKGVDVDMWYGFFLPKGTPAAIVQTLNGHIGQAFVDPKIVKQLADVGILPMREPVEQFQKRIAADHAKWREIVRTAGIKAE